MNIREFSHNLQKIYQEMSETFSRYQETTGLNCLSGCGRCCLNPEIEASPLEMIPMALKIFDEGKFEEWVDLLEKSEQAHCLNFVPMGPNGEGRCENYHGRPSLCRMFGVAGYFNKHQQVTLSVCRYIKENYKEEVQSVQEIASELNTPMLAHWSARLATLEPKLIQNRLPINQALLKALHQVGLYMQYHEDYAPQ